MTATETVDLTIRQSCTDWYAVVQYVGPQPAQLGSHTGVQWTPVQLSAPSSTTASP